MSETDKQIDVDSTPADSESISWRTHPVRRKPLMSAGVTLFVVVIAIGIYYSLESFGFALLAVVVMFGSLAKFYFPTAYTLDETGITIKTTTQTLKKEWKLFRRIVPDKRGVFLSPFEEQKRIENFRGVYLMCEGNQEQVAEFARKQIVRIHGAGPTESRA